MLFQNLQPSFLQRESKAIAAVERGVKFTQVFLEERLSQTAGAISVIGGDQAADRPDTETKLAVFAGRFSD